LGLTALLPESHILNDGIRTVLAKPTGHSQTYAAPHIETIQCGSTAVDLPDLIRHLSGQGMRSLMVEGGKQVEAWQCIGGVGVSAYVRKDATVRSVAA
jgi:riboflavin biosynthesis pyrimidine reductase